MKKKENKTAQYSDKEIAFIENAMELQEKGFSVTICNQEGRQVATGWITDMDLTREEVEATCAGSDTVTSQRYMTAKYTLHITEFL